MRLYYFVHLTGRDYGNSGVQRVVRNLGAALQQQPDLTLLPVRWCRERRAVVHAEQHFLDTLRLFSGPRFVAGEQAGEPIDLDVEAKPGDWLLMPEVPHLNSHDDRYPSVHLSYLTGFLRRNGFRTAVIFHDILPLSHLGREDEEDRETLKFIAYANALAFVELVIPVSIASATALQSWFGRNGVPQSQAPAIVPTLLPEEMIGVQKHKYLREQPSSDNVELVMWGSIHRHKNQLGVMQAFNTMHARRPDLNVTLHAYGHVMGELATQIALAVRRSQGAIKLHGFVDDDALHEAIGRARATVFLSLAEGYGLPVAESLWLGRPCLTSARAPMTEVAARGGCLLADPTSELDIASAMELIVGNDDLLAKLLSDIADREMRTWAEYANSIHKSLMAPTKDLQVMFLEGEPVLLRGLAVKQRDILPSELKYHDIYLEEDYAILVNGRIEYSRSRQGFAHVQDLFYGPYIDLAKGKYRLNFVGKLEGEAELRITGDHGKYGIINRKIEEEFDNIEFELENYFSAIEFIISKSPKTLTVEIDRIVIERLL